MSCENTKNFAATQKVIRNKFKIALKNRIERERSVNHVLKPLTDTQAAESIENNASQMYSTLKTSSNKINKKYHDSNKLCARLRLLIATASSNVHARSKCMLQMKAILAELRKQKIVV